MPGILEFALQVGKQGSGDRIFEFPAFAFDPKAEVLQTMPVDNGAGRPPVETQAAVGRIKITQDNLPGAGKSSIIEHFQFFLAKGDLRPLLVLFKVIEA